MCIFLVFHDSDSVQLESESLFAPMYILPCFIHNGPVHKGANHDPLPNCVRDLNYVRSQAL